MRKLAVALVGLFACGSNKAAPDAQIIKIVDAAIDAHPDSPPPPPPIDAQVFDFTCAGKPLPTTAADPITIAGTTQEISTSGIVALGGVSLQSFKTGTATALDTVASGTTGTFTTGNLVTGGTPLDGYLEATVPGSGNTPSAYRGTFIYPADPLAANLTGAPVVMIKQTTFNLLATQVASVTQDDTNNGALLMLVTDCAGTPINGATITAVQGTTDVSGMSIDLGMFAAQAAGTFFVFNVPAGATDVGATYMGHTFRTHTVTSYKKDDTLPNGSITLTIVKPGP